MAALALEDVNVMVVDRVRIISGHPADAAFRLKLFHGQEEDGPLVGVVGFGYHVGDDAVGPLGSKFGIIKCCGKVAEGCLLLVLNK